MTKKFITIKGARVNNLKNIDLQIPINKITCIFGPSGSGKTSIAFHTLFNESKRRFLNSFPSYLKFFSDRPAPVDVDLIEPVLPVFGLPQINPVVGTRNTVADTMHVTELLQSLYFNFSSELCPDHMEVFQERKFSDYIQSQISGLKSDTFYILLKREDFTDYFSNRPFPSRSIKSKRSKKIADFDHQHEFWEVMRFKSKNLSKLNEKADEYLRLGLNLLLLAPDDKKLVELKFKSSVFACPISSCEQKAETNLSIMHFSPYNALGACSECNGFGENLDFDLEKLVDQQKSIEEDGIILLNYKRYGTQKEEFIKLCKKKKISTKKIISELKEDFWTLLYEGEGKYYGFNYYFAYLARKKYKMNVRVFLRNIQKTIRCDSCGGARIGVHARKFFLFENSNRSLSGIYGLTIFELYSYLNQNKDLLLNENKDSVNNLKKILQTLETALSIGLGHLGLLRKSKTLSAGEYQRLLLLKYLSYEGTGALFIFDEPSLGLCESELKSLLKGFKKLIAQKNSIILVDHNEYLITKSEYLVEMGPSSGAAGGEVLFVGASSDYKFKKVKNNLKPLEYGTRKWIEVEKPKIYNKLFESFKIPANEITWVHGPSGSGKSSCLVNILAAQLHYELNGSHLNMPRGSFDKIIYGEKFKDIIIVDANLNRYTSRSTVGSMTDLFGVTRKHFAKSREAKILGLVDGHFSYNSELGQCLTCGGRGINIIEMQFLEDIVLTCEDCKGKRLKPIYADLSDGERTVNEAYIAPISEAFSNIKLTPKYSRILEQVKLLNLDYLSLSRQVNSLSGGEKQRLYLLNKMQKDITNSFIIFENISFGLSRVELQKVVTFLQVLCQKSNTVVVIDQHPIFEKIATYHLKF